MSTKGVRPEVIRAQALGMLRGVILDIERGARQADVPIYLSLNRVLAELIEADKREARP